MELDLLPLNLPSDNERPIVMAGPCSAETEEQVMQAARALAQKGCHIFRAGAWKPRTKPGGFEGNGEMALPWLKCVKEETGMLIATEVATPKHVELCLKHDVDILWIGARTSANPFAMQALADSLRGVDMPVLVKNPVNPDLELWIGGMERINQAAIGSHTSRLFELRQQDVSQLAHVANTPRTAPKNTRTTHYLRPKPHRWKARTGGSVVPTGHGPGLRRTDCRESLQPRQSVERCKTAGYTRCSRLYSLATHRTRQRFDAGGDHPIEATN